MLRSAQANADNCWSGTGHGSCYGLCPPELQQVVRGTDQCPFLADSLQSAPQELPEAPRLFDLPVHRFNYRLPSRVDLTASLRRQFALHSLLDRQVRRGSSSRCGRQRVIVFAAASCNERFDPSSTQFTNVRLRPEPGIRQHLFRLASQHISDRIDRRQQVLDFRCLGRHVLRDDHLRVFVDGDV